MKQVLQNFRTGVCSVHEVPDPLPRPGFVLVRTEHSVISSGTEGGTVALGRMSLIGKARARPEQVKKVLQVARTRGAWTAYQAARRSLEMPVALGYCAAGTVIEAGAGVTGLAPGDRVACGGQGYANHAEIVCVPRNLCVAVPAAVPMRAAAFTTLGAIALQSLRVAGVRLGEKVVVIGLGLVGLLAAQLLRAAGCSVFGIDVDPERLAFARAEGWCEGAVTGAGNLTEQVRAFSAGQGADAVIITAATADNQPVALAGVLARRKGRVVVVGRTDMRAPRETYLFKELELATSMAYGPGTGDPVYEEQGQDYPYAYVRWTEGRNMAAFLEQLAAGAVRTEPLVTHEFGIDDAPRAFDVVTGRTGERATAVMLGYPARERAAGTAVALRPRAPARPRAGRALGVSVIGAGSYAVNEFLPLLARREGLRLRGISSATGVRARALGEKYGFGFCDSGAEAILADEATDCVFILTRHDSHAALAAAALLAGKHVFVEKPLALAAAELEAVEQALAESEGLLMVGFNRRYAPLARQARAFFGERAQPAAVLYRANVGYRPPGHWLHDPRQGGGVVLGEACHHLDFCNWFVGAPVSAVSATRLDGPGGDFLAEDNVSVTIRYADGSLAHLAYLSNGAKAFSSERVELYADNRTAAIDDYRLLELGGEVSVRRRRQWRGPDRGHAGQLAAFLAAAGGDAAQAIDSAGYVASSRLALEVAAQVGTSSGGQEA